MPVLRSLGLMPNVNAEFIRKAAENSERLDGRGLLDRRPPKSNFPSLPESAMSHSTNSNSNNQAMLTSSGMTTFGVATAKLGNTVVTCAVSGDLAEPSGDRPAEGMVNFRVEIPDHAKPDLMHGVQSNVTRQQACLAISRIIEASLRESKAVDTETLCVVAGRAVWSLTCKISVESDDGNVISAAHLAAAMALLHFRRPEVSVSNATTSSFGGTCAVMPIDECVPVPLVLHHIPLSFKFAFVAGRAIMDPTASEERVASGTLTIVANAQGEVLGLHKAGLVEADPKVISQCVKLAAESAIPLHTWLTAEVEAAIPKQVVRGLKSNKKK